MRRAGRALVAVTVAAAAVAGARAVTPTRFPPYDGTLDVRAGDASVELVASWSTDGAVPPVLAECPWVVLVLPPAGAGGPDAATADGAVRPSSRGPAARVREQYAEVLPPGMAERGYSFVLPPGTRRLSAAWALPAGAVHDGAGAVRAWVSAACPDALRGLVELDRPAP